MDAPVSYMNMAADQIHKNTYRRTNQPWYHTLTQLKIIVGTILSRLSKET